MTQSNKKLEAIDVKRVSVFTLPRVKLIDDRFGYKIAKRSFDICVGFVGTVVMLPVVGVVKLINMCHGDFAPVLYAQKRIGKDGKEIKIYKIRSMVPDADTVLEELLEDPEIKAEWDEYRKIKDDPRITCVGKFIRKTSLDELPQFLNILDGSMSLVGPRPLVSGELDEHHGNHEIYESVKPGITGWWACNGRSNVNYNVRLHQEYFYVENQCIKLDLVCIVRTVKGVFRKEGAE